MYIEIYPEYIIDLISISTAFMLGLLFITSKSKNNKANIFLGLFLWSLASEVLGSVLEWQDIELPAIASGLLTLPLLFLYIIRTLNYRLKSWYILLIIPFITELTGIISEMVYYIAGILFMLYILHILNKHRQQLGDFYSDTENKTLSWIRSIIYIFLFFYLFWTIEDIVSLQFEFVREYFALASSFLTLAMIYWIGHNGFHQPHIINASIETSEEKQSSKPKEDILPKENINEESKEHSANIFQQLTQKVKDEKLFLQKDITIRSLSHQLNINEKEFSKLIKIHTQKNFYHYINQFRIEEFKRLVKTEKANQLSLLGLSEEAGFCSRSTFYSIFKTSEGITPKQYKDQFNKSE